MITVYGTETKPPIVEELRRGTDVIKRGKAMEDKKYLL
jgi:hypothetical protein